jgi:hypothetical protein
VVVHRRSPGVGQRADDQSGDLLEGVVGLKAKEPQVALVLGDESESVRPMPVRSPSAHRPWFDCRDRSVRGRRQSAARATRRG